MFTRGDFHIHTTASDGNLSPTEVILYAKKRGLDTIAITDHNSTEGIKEASRFAVHSGVSVIPGVELSTRYNGLSIHVLGYFRSLDFYGDTFQKTLSLIKCHKFKEARKLLERIVPLESTQGHISVNEGINLLKAVDASVVLAHPTRINKNVLIQLLNYPFDGIEAKYCWNNSSDTELFIKLALTKFQFYTSGSDFHSYSKSGEKHCYIGDPFLDALEIRTFLRNSRALIFN